MHDALVKMIVRGVAMLYPVVWGITYLPVTQHLRLLQLERQLQILKQAGVPILLGTDSGNWPMFPWVFYGPTTVNELELMVDAGLSPLDAIVAATATPARMLGMEQELGEVEVGFDADLIVLDGDPLVDIRAFRTPRLIVQDGVAKTWAEWMSSAP
jgi:imidazolonepropionase-like amidohydrolase